MRQEVSQLPEAALEFLSRFRGGVDQGMDPRNAAERAAAGMPRRFRDAVERMGERLRGEYDEDEWGFDEEFAEAAYPFFELLYTRWWRIRADGLTNVPSHGAALLVCNRARAMFPFDAAASTAAIMHEHPLPRWPRPLVSGWTFELPYISFFMRKVGGVPVGAENAERLLAQHHLVTAFPADSGVDELVDTAERAGAPVVPVAITATSGLPPRWRLEFGEPLDPGDHPREQIRETIQRRFEERV